MYAQVTARFWVRMALRAALGERGYLRWSGRRRERHYRSAGVVFLHIPKAAGSSISQALYGTRLGHPTAEEVATYSPGAWENLPRFAVIRDPFSRLVSAHRYVVSGGTREGAVRFRRAYRSAAFRSFERFVKDWLPTADLMAQDIVFWPQRHFLSRGGKPDPLVEVLALEDTYRLGAHLALFGVTKLPVRNRTTSGDGGTYDPEMERVVREVYSGDFELYAGVGRERLCD